MTSEPRVLHVERRVGNANLRLSGYAVSEEGDQPLVAYRAMPSKVLAKVLH